MALIKFGNISEVFPDKGTARVIFKADDMVSFPIPFLVSNSSGDKYARSFEVNEHVVCLMDLACENGVILGAIYDNKNAPPSDAAEGITAVNFSDGTKVVYNTNNSELEINVQGTKIKASPAGLEISKGGESLKSILSDILTESSTETHPTPAGPSSPPINAPAYIAIKARLQTLFTG